GIQREDSIASRRIDAGVNLRIHVSSHFITYSIDNGRSSPACINELHLTTGQTTQEAPSQSIVANIANLIVQAALQVTALTPIHLLASNSGQFGNLIAQLSRIAGNGSSGALVVVAGVGSVAGGVAGGQHADGHNAGQHQRSNLLEFHNDFFLLMVYKR